VGLFSKKSGEIMTLKGKALSCLVCGNDHFFKQEGQLNTAGLTFLGLDWANATALCCVCDSCGYIHWFMPK
jgi:predicted nucleic-acid-binding Zn-ribbon protein